MEGFENVTNQCFKLWSLSIKKMIESAIRSCFSMCSNGWFDTFFDENKINSNKMKQIIWNIIAKKMLEETYGDSVKAVFNEFKRIHAYEIRNIAERLRITNWKMPGFEELKYEIEKLSFNKEIELAIRSNSGVSLNGWSDLSFDKKECNIDKRKRIMRNEIAKKRLKEMYGNNIKTIFTEYIRIYAYEIRNIAGRFWRIKKKLPDFGELRNEILSYSEIEKICFTVFPQIRNAEYAIEMEKIGNEIKETRLELYNIVQDSYGNLKKIYLECVKKWVSELWKRWECLKDYWEDVYISSAIKEMIVEIYISDKNESKNELKNDKGREDVFDYIINKVVADGYNWWRWVGFSKDELMKEFNHCDDITRI